METNERNEEITSDMQEEKIKAAYALNMCTVSVSQIIDYKDLNILEQEYNAILNNLNLEQIPKDDALLHILKQLLDTITYFRIEEGEREMIEKEYQQKMKNAIWSAAPKFNILISGDVFSLRYSLMSQIGTMYMNYRRSKAEADAEKEFQMWQLQKTAIEQFNGLRRELFDTAWRLASVYDFPDKYRLTERQITQYNKILMDYDEVRKYERLYSIQDKFEAYPPFWYFIGNAANYIAENKSLELSDETRGEYRKEALKYFEKYENLNRYSILREDQMAASCALEHIDLLLLEEKPELEKIEGLIEQAVEKSGSVPDILEMCSIAYLKIGSLEKAANILRMLVNEDYNKVINAQLLSSIYVRFRKRKEYETLSTRVDSDYLYPMPLNDIDSLDELNQEFEYKQKEIIKKKFEIILDEYRQKYSIKWNKIASGCDVDEEYPDSFYDDTPKAQKDRKKCAKKVFANAIKRADYQNYIAGVDYVGGILCIMNEMWRGIIDSETFENVDSYAIEDSIRKSIRNKKGEINRLQENMKNEKFFKPEYDCLQKINFKSITEDAFELMKKYVAQKVDNAGFESLTALEGELLSFCSIHKLENPEITIEADTQIEDIFEEENEIFTPELLGEAAVKSKRHKDFMNDMVAFVKEKMKDVQFETKEVYFRDTDEFSEYFKQSSLKKYSSMKQHTVVVMKDKREKEKSFDLLFTTRGIVSVIKGKGKVVTPYNKVKYKDNKLLLNKKNYKDNNSIVEIMYKLSEGLSYRFISDIQDKVEHIDMVNTETILQWFYERKPTAVDNIIGICAVATEKNIERLGYSWKGEFELNSKKHLLQCLIEERKNEKNDFILREMRIIEAENIGSNLQKELQENKSIKIKLKER